MNNSFDTRSTINANGTDYEIYDVSRLAGRYPISRLPYVHKILLENMLSSRRRRKYHKRRYRSLGELGRDGQT